METIQSAIILANAILEKAIRDYLRDVRIIFFKERELKNIELLLEGVMYDDLKDYGVKDLKNRLQKILDTNSNFIRCDAKRDSIKALDTNNKKIIADNIQSLRTQIRNHLKERKKSLQLQIHQTKKDQYIIIEYIKSDTFEILYNIDPTDLLIRMEMKENQLIERLNYVWSEE